MVCVAVRFDHGELTIEAVRMKICETYPGTRYLVVCIYDVYPSIHAVFECRECPDTGKLNIEFEGNDDVCTIYTCFVLDICTTWEEGKEFRDKLCRRAADYVYKH